MHQHRARRTSALSKSPPSLSRQWAAAGVRYLFFIFLLGAASARIVGDSSDEVHYTPAELGTNILCTTTIGPDCANRWYSETMPGAYKGAVKSTPGPNASLQLTFRGSMIVIKGVTDRRGARAFVRLDFGAPSMMDTGSGDQQQHVGVILYSIPGLDPTVDHTLTIEYDPSSVGRRRPHLLRIDSFEITDADGQSSVAFPSALPTSAETPFPTSNSFPNATTSSPNNGASNSDPPVVGTTSNSSTIPIVAGLATGLVTLIVASVVIFFLLRRRRAVRVRSMELPRSEVMPAPAPMNPPSRMAGLANLAYAFNRRGSSVTSSAERDLPAAAPPPVQPLPPLPRVNTYVSPYTYQRRGPLYPMSETASSIGPPVDERPPNIPRRAPASPVVQSPRILRVHNPGSSVVSSNAH